jgi:hypothetical protein
VALDAIKLCGGFAALTDNGMSDAEACLERFDLKGLYGAELSSVK